MSFSKIAATFGPAFRRSSAAFLSFPVAGVVAPSFGAVRMAAEAFMDDRAETE